MKNWIFDNFWIKVLSLLLAIVTWFYVNGELAKEGRISARLYESSYRQRIKNPPEARKNQLKKGNRGYIMERK